MGNARTLQYPNPDSADKWIMVFMYRNMLAVQWNPSIAATLGEQYFGRYIGVAFIEGLFYTNCSFGTWIPGRYTEVAFIQGWPLRGVPLYLKVIIHTAAPSPDKERRS